MKRLFAGYLCAMLLLAGCSAPAADPTPSPAPSPSATPVPTPVATPLPTPSATPVPATEESVRASSKYADAAIYDVFTDGDDLLVWYGPAGSAPATDYSDLDWVDGQTGQSTLLPRNGSDIITSVAVSWPDQITVCTSGISYVNNWRGMPMTYRYTRTQDGHFSVSADPWTGVDTALTIGVRRAAVVSDARAGVNDLALVFVPPASEEGMGNFIAAATYIPQVETRYDRAENVFYVTIRDTVLESGDFRQGGEDWVYDFMREQGLQYPYSTPIGSLGADNRFFTNAAISSDGTDTTVTLRLTKYTSDYTAEVLYLGDDMFPTLRLVFRGGSQD